MGDGTEPIDPDEVIYRRIPTNGRIYKPGREPPLSAKAFQPRPIDAEGVSVVRGGYGLSPADVAALGDDQMEFYVMEFRARDLRAAGMELKPDPLENCAGHAIISNVKATNLNDPAVGEILNLARTKPFMPHGPFPGKTKNPNRAATQ